MRILLLGHTGFLGSQVMRQLEESPHEVFFASISTGVDLRKYDNFESTLVSHRPDTVINCAAHVGGIQYGLTHPGEIFSDNLAITLNLYNLARKFEYRVLNPISNCVYPRHLEKFTEKDLWSGELDPSVLTYGAVRRLTLVAAESFHKQYGVQSINLVFPNLYGEGDHFDPIRAHALGAMTYRILQAKVTHAKSVEIWGTGAPIREWLHVEDAARYITESLSLSWSFESINIGQGKGISIMELAQLIKTAVGYKGEIVLNKEQPDGAPCKIMDSSKSDGIFAIRPTIDLPSGISRTVAWYSSQHLRDKHD
jgi:GDP-L-fucose synthase